MAQWGKHGGWGNPYIIAAMTNFTQVELYNIYVRIS